MIGYVAKQAVPVGQTERIYVSAPGSRTAVIRIFRMGWYGGKDGREVLVSRPGSYATLQGGRFLFRGGTQQQIEDAVRQARAQYRLTTEPVPPSAP